ncbi:unnamed protein product [Polarella glacialis]|uniref:Uncharacterized protein n=1 Tax=Polarella glacialis TaxID=89957 RepID=A0A813K8C4_POLGL|nr:unnamed protein product [Polarella glacialis]
MQQELGTVQTLDESPPTFTRLAIQDPTSLNDRIVVTFQLNEAGTAYCRTKRKDSAETTLRINQILTANFGAEVTLPTQTASITITKLEAIDTASLYEAAQYEIYCWAKDSAVRAQAVWVTDSTAPTIIVVSREALAETVIQVTLQLNEPGTIWCQLADKDRVPAKHSL